MPTMLPFISRTSLIRKPGGIRQVRTINCTTRSANDHWNGRRYPRRLAQSATA